MLVKIVFCGIKLIVPMPTETNKHTYKLNQRIKSLKNRTFSEDDIKLLLIEIREHLKDEKFLREICDFVAHPRRTRGICHDRVDSRYAKMKFIKEGEKKLFKDPEFVKLNGDKPWSFFSDILLGYIDLTEIPKQIFELIILEGIEEIDEKLFFLYFKLNKTEIRQLVINSYNRKNGQYILNANLDNEKKAKLDNILKFIRGTITGKPAFEQVELEKEIIQALNRIQRENGYKRTFIEKRTISEMILCVICLLHYATFELFDKQQGVAYLYINKKNKESIFSLYVQTDNFLFPIISTNLNVKDYVIKTSDIFDNEKIENQVYASRIENGRIQVKRH